MYKINFKIRHMFFLAAVSLFATIHFINCDQAEKDADVKTNKIDGMETVESIDNLNKGYYNSGVLWPTNSSTKMTTISVCWMDFDEESQWFRDTVRSAIEGSWEAVSRVNFTGWGECGTGGSDLEIEVSDEISGLGKTMGLGKTLKYETPGMIFNEILDSPVHFVHLTAVAMHEFGHALGIVHEQARPENEFGDYCDEFQGSWENEQGFDGDTPVGSFDYDSIMNYCAMDGQLENPHLTDTDIKTIQTMYPCNCAPFDESGGLKSCAECQVGTCQ